jgi:FtsP/CotA-like multicopper oxidase with cupredoxin domain
VDTAAPLWQKPPNDTWDNTVFGASRAAAQPDHIFAMVFAKDNAANGGFNRWTINGIAYPHTMAMAQPMLALAQGWRHGLPMRNGSDEIHPIHPHRHGFALTRVAEKPASGVMKDVVMPGSCQEAEIDFAADNPGLTLFPCHQQLHMDYGFMALLDMALLDMALLDYAKQAG